MDKTILVERNIEDGERIIHALDNAGFSVNGALWRYYPDLSKWKFIIISDLTDRSGPINLYSKIENILANIENPIDTTLEDIKILNSLHRDIKLLKRLIKTPPDAIIGTRFSNITINGVFFEDLYIYRMS